MTKQAIAVITSPSQEVLMIGAPGQKDIVLAYSVPKHGDLPADAKAALGFAQPAIDDFAKKVRQKIITLKTGEREIKSALEKTKDEARKKLNDQQFHDYLFRRDGYIHDLRKIGMASCKIMPTLNPQISDLASKVKKAANQLSVGVAFGSGRYTKFEVRATGSEVSIVAIPNRGSEVKVATICELITDSTRAYDRVDIEGAKRQVYRKRISLLIFTSSQRSTSWTMMVYSRVATQ